MQGYRNEEMEARWYALGVFSPINRLHSTKDLFYSKEPWFYRDDIRRSMDNILRFRHRMLPYLYTMNYRAYSENKPLIWPMYYTHPKNQEAYEVKNQYWFGSELLVAPITTPNVKGVNRGKVSVWLPEGTYIDIFTKMTYRGGRYINMYRDLQTIPVLAKAGAILPLTEEIYGIDACRNPETMTIQVFAGANGQFAMYEDDNETCAYMKGVSAVTEFIWNWEDGQSFRILPVQGERSLLPEKRTFTLEFVGVTDAKVHVTVGGSTVAAAGSYDRKERTLRVTVPDVDGTQEVCVTFDRPLQLAANPVEEELFTLLANAEIEYLAKRRLYDLAAGGRDAGSIIGALQGLGIDADLTSAISEIIIAM
jgi:alpha-glucosidase (family GH31 glycosyl hydrolase)